MKLADINVLDPDSYARGIPHEHFEHLRRNAPCHYETYDAPGMIKSAWVLSRHEDVRRTDRNSTDFLNYGGVTLETNGATNQKRGRPAMTGMDGEQHDRNRRLVNKIFTRRAIAAFEGSFRQLSQQIVESAIAKRSFDFVDNVSVELPMQVICSLIGVPEKDWRKVVHLANVIASPLDPDFVPSKEVHDAAIQGIWDYAIELADLRRQAPADDVMSKLVREFDGQTLTEGELMGLTLLLIGAGNETTRNAMTHSITGLVRNPDQMSWLRAHTDDIPSVAIEELLRFTTPVVFMRRTAARDVEMHGQMIREGDSVLLMYASANFDPEQFDRPLELDLTRSPNDHLTFGFGPHFCLGAFVARLELKVLLEELLKRTSDIRLDGDPVYGRSSFLRPVKHLPVTLVPS